MICTEGNINIISLWKIIVWSSDTIALIFLESSVMSLLEVISNGD